MSAERVQRWEAFFDAMKRGPAAPPWPVIECTEDLVWATRAVRLCFQKSAASIKEFDAFNKRKYGDPVWYRGEAMREKGSALCPSVFRSDYYLRGVDGYRSTEKWMITEFWRKAVLRGVDCPPREDGLAWLALAQHHGLPTRLLDWTESILVAAWFAVGEDELRTAKRDLSEKKVDMTVLRQAMEDTLGLQSKAVYGQLDEDCAKRVQECSVPNKTQTVIWALSPSLMNWRLNEDGPFLFPKADDAIVRDAFTGDNKSEEKVCAIWQQPVHARMVQQNAYFTIHGSEKSLIHINSSDDPQGPCFLYKLVISPEARQSILEDLLALGVSKSTIYPGLDSLCVDVSERWKEIVQRIRSGQSP
ncbi:MAG: FRG domain-containing protein [Planctomycetes bacterium]|nr:FRG domain-containing protein [Planctomycetota bacterium]